MRFTTALRYSLARMLIKSAGFSIVPSWVSRSILIPTFDSLVAEGLRKNAVYFSCLSALAFSFPEPPLLVYEDDRDNAPPLPNHPMRRLFVKPNADMGEDAMQAAIIVWLALGGNCYLHKLRNSRRQPIGLRPYHDGVITPVPSKDPDHPSWIDHYDFRTGDGELKPIPPEDIIHIKWPILDPLQPWMAQPPILAAAREVDADNEATRYVGTLLQNDAIPRTIITQSERMALTPEEVARMRAQWIAMFGRNGTQGGVAILEPGTSVERLSLNMEELNFSALHDIPEQRICAVMRVPAVVAGLGDDPTYANSEQAFKRFTLATLVPLWGVVASAIQAGLADDFGNSVVVKHHLGRVQTLQEDETAKWGRVKDAYSAGYLGWSEARTAIGLPAEPPPGEVFLLPAGAALRPTAALTAPAPQIEDSTARQASARPALAETQTIAGNGAHTNGKVPALE